MSVLYPHLQCTSLCLVSAAKNELKNLGPRKFKLLIWDVARCGLSSCLAWERTTMAHNAKPKYKWKFGPSSPLTKPSAMGGVG